MIAFLLAAQIVTSAPPLTPQEAARILRASHSPPDMTDYRSWTIEFHPRVIDERRPAPQPKSEPSASPRPLQNPPTIGQCWVGTPCIVGPPTIYVEGPWRKP